MLAFVPNKVKWLLTIGVIDFETDVFKAILMTPAYTFDADADHAYADVSAVELGTGLGYVAGGKQLLYQECAEDDANDWTEVRFHGNVSWTANGGDLGPVSGFIIYDDTVAAAGGIPADPIIAFIAFGAEVTQEADSTASLVNVRIRIK